MFRNNKYKVIHHSCLKLKKENQKQVFFLLAMKLAALKKYFWCFKYTKDRFESDPKLNYKKILSMIKQKNKQKKRGVAQRASASAVLGPTT